MVLWEIASCFSLSSEEVCEPTICSGSRASPLGNRRTPFAVSRKIASTQKGSPPVLPTQDASYLPQGLSGDAPRQTDMAEALDVGEPRKPSLKAKLYDELRRFLMIFAYLWLVFFVFLVHEWIVLAGNHIGFRFYGFAAINALVLSKIMLIAEGLQFGERFDDKPLIIPIAYKSVLFSVLLVVAYILEEIALGWFHGKSVAESFPQIGGGGVVGMLCVAGLLCIALVPFFAFREIARAMGEAEFRSLMLGPPSARADKITQGAN